MADIEPPVALYDFLYKDAGRIASYYAQMFQGHLANTERSTVTKNSEERTLKANVGVAGGDYKSIEENQETLKTVIDPHDRATTEVLSFFVEGNHLEDNIVEAGHGSLVITQGTIVFVEKTILELAGVVFDALIDTEKRKPKNQQNQESLVIADMMKKMLPKIALPAAFLMHTEDGLNVVGTLKEDGMQEPISSYYFKHGTNGLDEVYVIGIKEAAGRRELPQSSAFIGVAQQAAQALSTMLFPDEAHRVTPLAIFRKLL